MDSTARRYFWAVISPSALHSVTYLKSTFANSASVKVECGEYLALVLEPNPKPRLGIRDGCAVAYLVQLSQNPLPETYIPIAPSRMGSRKPLVPGFKWPFGECVIDTGKEFIFEPVAFDLDVSTAPLSADAASYFTAIQDADSQQQNTRDWERRLACRKREREAAEVPDDDDMWTTFSLKSTAAEPTPGQFFPPARISARIRFNIESLERVLPASQCFDDEHEVEKLRARFSRPATEKTILWALNQASCANAYTPVDDDFTELCPSILELSKQIERPYSPDRSETAALSVLTDEDGSELSDESVEDPLAIFNLPNIARPIFLPPPPLFDPPALAIMYFDIYGALIDSESGIFAALEPLLARCFRRFDRAEALSFYFESESEMKRRTPTARYPEILAQAHKDISMRLGLTSSNKETSQFASSILHWPLFDGAVQCLQTLYHQIPTLVALVDMDHDTFTQTASYPLISPYFAEMFTWDATHSYRPDLATFAAPFSYHDAGDVPRKRRCLVSGRLFRDLEVAYVASILGIWMWHPTTSLRKEEGSFVWEVCEGLTDLVSVIIRAKARCHDM